MSENIPKPGGDVAGIDTVPESSESPSVITSQQTEISKQIQNLAATTAESLVQIIQQSFSLSKPAQPKNIFETLVDTFIADLNNQVQKKLSDIKDVSLQESVLSKHTEDNVGGASDYSDTEPEPTPNSAPVKHKPFFRRFSFMGIKKARALQLFHKQDSEEAEFSSSGSVPTVPRVTQSEKKNKFSKIFVECQKEGLVNLIADVAMDGSSKWEKSKMVLVKATGGFMIEFYCPPNMSRPRIGFIKFSYFRILFYHTYK